MGQCLESGPRSSACTPGLLGPTTPLLPPSPAYFWMVPPVPTSDAATSAAAAAALTCNAGVLSPLPGCIQAGAGAGAGARSPGYFWAAGLPPVTAAGLGWRGSLYVGNKVAAPQREARQQLQQKQKQQQHAHQNKQQHRSHAQLQAGPSYFWS